MFALSADLPPQPRRPAQDDVDRVRRLVDEAVHRIGRFPELVRKANDEIWWPPGRDPYQPSTSTTPHGGPIPRPRDRSGVAAYRRAAARLDQARANVAAAAAMHRLDWDAAPPLGVVEILEEYVDEDLLRTRLVVDGSTPPADDVAAVALELSVVLAAVDERFAESPTHAVLASLEETCRLVSQVHGALRSAAGAGAGRLRPVGKTTKKPPATRDRRGRRIT